MILAKARLIERSEGTVRVGLTFPTGFDPDEVLQETVRANGDHPPRGVHVDARRGRLEDIYREFEVSFPDTVLGRDGGLTGALQITGRLRRGLPFSARLAIVTREGTDH